MKKTLAVVTLDQLEKTVPKTSNAQLLASRKGKKFWAQNLELGPGVSVSVDPEKDEMTIKISLREGEHLVAYDDKGIAEQREF